MKIEAEKFNKQPAAAYRAADKGQAVEIEHKHYPDKVFTLEAKERDLITEDEESENE